MTNVKYMIKGIFVVDGEKKFFYYNNMLDNWVKACFPKGQEFGASVFKTFPKKSVENAKNIDSKRSTVRFCGERFELVKIEILSVQITRRNLKIIDRVEM